MPGSAINYETATKIFQAGDPLSSWTCNSAHLWWLRELGESNAPDKPLDMVFFYARLSQAAARAFMNDEANLKTGLSPDPNVVFNGGSVAKIAAPAGPADHFVNHFIDTVYETQSESGNPFDLKFAVNAVEGILAFEGMMGDGSVVKLLPKIANGEYPERSEEPIW